MLKSIANAMYILFITNVNNVTIYTFLLLILICLLYFRVILTFVHELGHRYAIRASAKQLNVKYKYRNICIRRKITLSDFYVYLDKNKCHKHIQKYIIYNSIAGFFSETVTHLFICLLCICSIFVYRNTCKLSFLVLLLIFLSGTYLYSLYEFLKSSDMKNIIQPENFKYSPECNKLCFRKKCPIHTKNQIISDDKPDITE